MQRNCTPNTSTVCDNHGRQFHGPNLAKVLNGRKQPIRGLWVRKSSNHERYYAQLRMEDERTGIISTRKIPLKDKHGKPVADIPQALAELERLRTQRRDNNLPVLRQTPKFAEYADDYLKALESGQGTKKPATIAKERSTLERWKKALGKFRLDQIRRFHLNAFLQDRQEQGVSPRTINLDVIPLRNVLKRAMDEQHILRSPADGMQPLRTTTQRRPFFNTADLAKICQAAFLSKRNAKDEAVPLSKNAQEFVDYIRFLAYSGARRNEALALRWEDVNFDAQQITIGALGDTKNRTPRIVDFNAKLKLHLLEMHRRRAPDCQWLFPSPQRGKRDIAVKTFRETLDLVRARAGLPTFQFHDCRHYFISMCVMSGVDFMTIATWAGHRDGGILIGKVYGHLANEHRKRMAEKVAFEPAVLPAVA